MTNASISINPTKFTIYDNDLPSEASDSEVDCDEWVTISSSTTTSTISTLPSHLNLKVKPVNKPRSNDTQNRYCHDEQQQKPAFPAAPPLPHSTAGIVPNTESTAPPDSSGNGKQIPAYDSAVSFLKASFHNLTAIYIVSPKSIRPNYPPPSVPQGFSPSLASLTTVSPNSPISTSTSSQRVGIQNEMYLRVCSDCAKPAMTIYCDGTWTSSSGGICSEHSAAVQGSSTNLKNRVGVNGQQHVSETCRFHSFAMAGCKICAGIYDRSFFGAVLEAVAPFNRTETVRMGISVFDMTVPVATETYRHVSGCKCSKWG